MKKWHVSALTIVLSVMISVVFCAPADVFSYDENENPWEYIDQNRHYYHGYAGYGNYESHDWSTYGPDVINEATLTSAGTLLYTCWLCKGTKTSTYAWKLESPDSYYYKSYNVTYHSPVYRNSKSITIELDNPIKGSVVKVKIGKKTYKKKVGIKKKIKIKIKKPKYGQKVKINVYYKGQCIGKTYWYEDGEYYLETGETVYYAKDIKKNMTKKQVRNLYYWGGPDDTGSSSGGWSYWYYDDGSYIGFKKGRVKYWYNAAG